ncbi:FAD-binding protein [Rickettsiales bacterium]|nr:FAD-binding protein [Rickettsiales bacterium]
MKILIIAEHDNKEVKAATYSCVTAANKIGSDITCLLLGSECNDAVQILKKLSEVKKVIFYNDENFKHQIAENLSKQIIQLVKEEEFTHILAPSSTFGKNLLPRVSALLDVQQISDVINIFDHETFERPIYAGNAVLKVKSLDKVKVITIRGTCFAQCSLEGNAEIEEKKVDSDFNNNVNFVKHELSKSDRPELTSAKVVISGGRGMQNGENFKLLEGIADKLGAAVGASRAAVDAGFVPNDWQVGQTGKIVAPDLYIAVGISGAIQHIAGIKDSKFIVAINKDEEAPIFKFSDYGLIGDLFEVLPKLEGKL